MMQRLRAVRDDDGGAMLIIALLVVTSVAVVTGALLSHGGTNFIATRALEGVAGTSYASDTAAKVAVNNLRLGAKAPGWVAPTFPGSWTDWVFTNNADGAGCFGADGTLPQNMLKLNNLYPKAGDQTADSSARVECAVVPGTGIFGGGTGIGVDDPDPTDAFARSLTTVGTTGALQGMTLKPLGTGNTAAMPVRGGIASKSFITVDNGALVTDGYVKAEGACTGVIVSNPAKVCNQSGSVPVPVAPPSPLTSVPAYQDPNAFSATAPIVAQRCLFQPGFYNNALALSAAVNSCTTARFASGKYYFDFNDEKHGGQNVWNITKTVIGGEYVGGDIPGTCKSPIFHDPIPGVQFVFGGTSRITVSDTAHVELCGPSSGGEPPLTLYQQPSGSVEVPLTLAPASAGNVDQRTGNSGGDKFSAGTVEPVTTPATSIQAAIAAADPSSVKWKIAGNVNDIGIDLRNFAGLASIPAGADITSAELRVKYQKTSTKSLQVTVNSQTPANLVVTAPDATGWGSVQLADQLRNMLASGALDATRPVLELRMMDASDSETLSIDAVMLSVTYTPPALEAAQDVEFILAPGGNFHGEFVVQGATYAPTGYVDLDPGSFTSALVAFRWGLVASGVDLKAQPSQTYGYPLVSMPDAGHGLGNRVTIVDLKVFVCVEQANCNAGGTHALTVRAAFTDPPYGATGAPVPGKRKVEILSWSEQR